MSAVLERADPRVALARLHAELDALSDADLSGLSEDEFLDFVRELERVRRRLPSVDHAVVAQAEGRDLLDKYKVRGVAQLLRGLLRLDPHEASGRVAAAHALGRRRALTGQPLPPVFEEVAAAQADGLISDKHARLIVETIEKLPDEASAEHGEQVEKDLVEFAGRFDPHQLGKIAARLRYFYDQDGRYDESEHRQRLRELTITARPDGSSSIRGEATAELTEFLLLHLDAFARPKPEIDGVKDPRTAAQRRHDALLEALKLNVRARQLPTVAGVTATIVLTMSAEDFEHRKGLARTAHGALIPVPEAMRISAGEYRLMNVVIDKTKGITAYSNTHRLYTETQRLAIAALDGGCTFENCNAPPGWCEIDHALDWAFGGKTSLDNAVMADRYHNNTAKKQGWKSTRINGRAAWIPPKWIDPQQRPRYNHLHDTEPTAPA
jgi:hypothetical protein